MTGLDSAIQELEQALSSPIPSQTRRGLVRQHIASLHEALMSERARTADDWLAPREGHLRRERNHLVRRVTALGECEEINEERFSLEVRRLLGDLEHHRQRLNDLVYDSVSMDLGGSE